jgi:hypothetical protein
MKNTEATNLVDNPLEKECQRLWLNISNKVHQANDFDLGSDVLEIRLEQGNKDHVCKKDFTIFEQDQYKFFEKINITIDDTTVLVTSIELAKLIFLNLAQKQKVNTSFVAGIFIGLCTLFAVIKDKGVNASLDSSDYKDFFTLLLTEQPTNNGLVKRLSTPSYRAIAGAFILPLIIKLFRSLGVTINFADLNQRSQTTIFNEVCLEVMGITYTDFSKGGSFNFLGLEVGKHYVDHCANVLEDAFQLSCALRKTLSRAEEVCEGKTLPGSAKNRIAFIAATLTGENLTDSVKKTNIKSNYTIEKIKESHVALLEEFRQQYESFASLSAINKFSVINQIIEASELPNRFDTTEFVRSILMAEYINDWGKDSEKIFSEYVAALKTDKSYSEQEKPFSLTYRKFISLCRKSVAEDSLVLPKKTEKLSEFIKNELSRTELISPSSVGGNSLGNLFSSVESAASVLFVALTGWRKSEFGFPMSSLTAEINTEVLDNLYTPWRFNVKWVVPKTSGESKLNREITSYAYQVAYMASIHNSSGSDKPALYSLPPQSKEQSMFDSGGYITNRIDNLWIHFINNYKLFNDENIGEYPDLIEMKDKLKKGLPEYEFSQISDRKIPLEKYRKGTLDQSTSSLLDERLSPETKAFLNDEDNSITYNVVRVVSKEVLGDLPYPTPHAFRHIWAEAVLTRYRGDVGKVIRANFKHMGWRFFMAYLRGKETQAIYKIAERSVISNIVKQYFQSANVEYFDYTGGYQRYVKKIARKTKVISPEEQAKIQVKITDRVVGINPNPTSTCLLRVDNQSRAKCAVDGIPQRRNAEPKFCFGCMHSDITDMNYEGIIISIKNDVTACRNPDLPYVFKSDQVEVVKLALARVKELKRNSGKPKYDKYIAHLEESIDMAFVESLKWSSKS